MDDTLHGESLLHHPWEHSTVLGGFALVSTNLVLVVVVSDLAYRWRWDMAVIFLCTMLASIAYHACRSGFVCMYRFRDHQVTDHIFVHTAIVYVASKLAVRRALFPVHVRHEYPELVPTARTALFFALLLPLVMFNMWSAESAWTTVIGVGMPVAAAVGGALLSGQRLFYNACLGYTGSVLFLVSAVFYGLMPHSTYEWSHSVWHMLSMLSVYFVAHSVEPQARFDPRTIVDLAPTDARFGRATAAATNTQVHAYT